MTSQRRPRPGLVGRFTEPLQGELERLWGVLRQFLVSSTWRLIDHDDGLYVQKYNPSTKQYVSKILIDGSGNIHLTGAVTPGATLDDVGRK